jgi:hypothetical protein
MPLAMSSWDISAVSGPKGICMILTSSGRLNGEPRASHRKRSTAAQRFSLTKLGEALKTAAPGSARATLLTGSSWVGSGFANLLHSLQTGRTGFKKAQGMPFFDYFM